MDPRLIYVLHAVFWGSLGIGVVLRQREQRRRASLPGAPGTGTQAVAVEKAPHGAAWLRLHMAGFFVLYFGLGNDVFGPQRDDVRSFLFPPQRTAAGILVLLGIAIFVWAMLFFRSWRIRAELSTGHELATGGPFALVRNPIYLSLDLLVVATWLWSPSWIVLAGALLVLLAGDLRARAEEQILLRRFGERYEEYRRRVKRFLPFLY